jgi:membrane protease YdiL (CAAX protease family)
VPTKAQGSISIGLALLLLLVVALGAGVAVGVAVGIEMAQGAASFKAAFEAVRGDVLSLALCQLVGLALATGVGVIVGHGSDVRFRDALEVRPVPVAISVLALTAGFALQFPLQEIANLLTSVHPALGLDAHSQEVLRQAVRIDGAREAITVPLALVAIPAISEELFFRGLLLPGLTQRHGARVGLGVSALLFGVAHGAPAAIVYAGIAGVVLGDLRRRTGSVLPCIALHGALNAVPLVIPSHVVPIPGFNLPDGHVPLALVLGGALVAIASLFVIGRLVGDPDEG